MKSVEKGININCTHIGTGTVHCGNIAAAVIRILIADAEKRACVLNNINVAHFHPTGVHLLSQLPSDIIVAHLSNWKNPEATGGPRAHQYRNVMQDDMLFTKVLAGKQ